MRAQQPAKPTANLLKALEKLGGNQAQVFALPIKDQDAATGANAVAGVQGVMVIQNLGVGGGTVFRGEAEVLLRPNQQLFLVSKEALPDVLVFDDGERTLLRTTTEGQPIDGKAPAM